jgi:hypothetical protein
VLAGEVERRGDGGAEFLAHALLLRITDLVETR